MNYPLQFLALKQEAHTHPTRAQPTTNPTASAAEALALARLVTRPHLSMRDTAWRLPPALAWLVRWTPADDPEGPLIVTLSVASLIESPWFLQSLGKLKEVGTGRRRTATGHLEGGNQPSSSQVFITLSSIFSLIPCNF